MESEQYKNYNPIQFPYSIAKETYMASLYQKLDVEVLKTLERMLLYTKAKAYVRVMFAQSIKQ